MGDAPTVPADRPRKVLLSQLGMAQAGVLRCLSSCWRMVTAPRMSGSTAGTFGGGGAGGVPRMRSSTHAPRTTGEVVVIRHPLVQHKLGLMRKKDTSTSVFRSLLAEISMLLAYEVTRDLPTHEVAAEIPGSIASTHIDDIRDADAVIRHLHRDPAAVPPGGHPDVPTVARVFHGIR